MQWGGGDASARPTTQLVVHVVDNISPKRTAASVHQWSDVRRARFDSQHLFKLRADESQRKWPKTPAARLHNTPAEEDRRQWGERQYITNTFPWWNACVRPVASSLNCATLGRVSTLVAAIAAAGQQLKHQHRERAH